MKPRTLTLHQYDQNNATAMVPKIPFLTACSFEKKQQTNKKKKTRLVGGFGYIFPLHQQRANTP